MKYIVLYLISCFLAVKIKTNGTKDAGFVEKFKVKHIEEGLGNPPDNGNKVYIHYTGKFIDTQITFDTTSMTKEPLSFTLGSDEGDHIKCFNEVVSRMTLHEKIRVVCPSSLAYGEKGIVDIIPPNTDLQYDIRLLRIDRKVKEDL